MRTRRWIAALGCLVMAAGAAGSYSAAVHADTPGTLVVVAGGARAGFAGDGGPATQARLNAVTGLAFDTAGNLYVGDAHNHRVRRIDPSGIITTVAGIGQAGFSGDGGPALKARLNNPVGLAFDPEGNLYIADFLNHCVRKVDRAGIISTVVGTGQAGHSGDGGPALEAQVNVPSGVAFDALGNMFVTEGNYIRRVDTNGRIATVVGGGDPADGLGDGGPATNARLNAPFPATLDAKGNLYVPDAGNNRVRRVDPSGSITTIAGGGNPADALGDAGPATEARLNYPVGAIMDPGGNLFISDCSHGRVRKVSPEGIITTVAGNGQLRFAGAGGPATEASLIPDVLAFDGAGNLYIGEGILPNRIVGHRVVKVIGVVVPR